MNVGTVLIYLGISQDTFLTRVDTIRINARTFHVGIGRAALLNPDLRPQNGHDEPLARRNVRGCHSGASEITPPLRMPSSGARQRLRSSAWHNVQCRTLFYHLPMQARPRRERPPQWTSVGSAVEEARAAPTRTPSSKCIEQQRRASVKY